MKNDTRQATTIVDRIKKLLYNYDLSIEYAKGQIKLRQATINLYSNDTRKYSQRKFLIAKIDKDRYENYIAELEDAKRSILDNLDILLSKYTERYKQVFIMYFLQNKTYDEICDATNYAPDGLKDIIARLKGDLIQLYFIDDEQ